MGLTMNHQRMSIVTYEIENKGLKLIHQLVNGTTLLQALTLSEAYSLVTLVRS